MLPLFAWCAAAPLAAADESGWRLEPDARIEIQTVSAQTTTRDEDLVLMQDLRNLLQQAEVDMTLFFRGLAGVDSHAPSLAPLGEAFYDPAKRAEAAPAFEAWLLLRGMRTFARDMRAEMAVWGLCKDEFTAKTAPNNSNTDTNKVSVGKGRGKSLANSAGIIQSAMAQPTAAQRPGTLPELLPVINGARLCTRP